MQVLSYSLVMTCVAYKLYLHKLKNKVILKLYIILFMHRIKEDNA